ncbi:little elongation complex subunit 2 [Pogona vitticeps]
MAAAAGKLLLQWDIPPRNGHSVYFSRDIYEKYSLAPTLSELLLLSKRGPGHNVNVPDSGQENKTSSEQPSAKAVDKGAEPSAEVAPFQDPQVPYPYFSSLTEREQRRYLFLLSTYAKADPHRISLSQQKDYSQYLQMKEFVSKEVAEFLKFTQNVARSCSKDYEDISEEALLYTQKFLSSRIASVRKYPESYTLHEVTSIMGGKFNPELTLIFEKCLVALGKVNLIKRYFPKLPAPIQLPDPHRGNELGIATPEQRASALHNDVSTDQNAEKLAAKYCPQVVLTSESLFTLLNNHGMDYREEWEIPVSVKIVSDTGLKPVKVVYIDPPVPKKEMTVREKNQVFHEFLTEYHMTKQSTVFAHGVVLDKLSEKPETPLEALQGRQMQVADSVDLDFDTDFTELETFGSVTKTWKASQLEKAPGKLSSTSSILLEHLKGEKEIVRDMKSGRREGTDKASKEREEFVSEQHFIKSPPPSGDDCDENLSVKSFKVMEVETEDEKVAEEKKIDSKIFLGSSEKTEDFKERTEEARGDRSDALSCPSDTDEESLVIDTECKMGHQLESSKVASDPGLEAETPRSSCSEEGLGEPLECQKSDGPQKAPGGNEPGRETDVPRKPSRRLSKECDPLGQILKMQTELLKPPSSGHQGKPEGIPERKTLNPTPSHGCSLPKALGLSSLEPTENVTTAEARLSWVTYFQGSQKGVLWDGSEDRSEYEPPLQGNLVYKLFSLEDLLLLVRCSVQKVELRPRNKKAKVRRHFPVYVLPKLEYQAFYGAEALTEGEICHLWTESLLHSNSSFEVGHIDALTSKLFLLEQLSAEDLKKRFGTFKPANSLNILQHILKKVTSLQEGSYLLAHTAGDSSLTIYKSSDGTSTRAAYNLHSAHSDLPRAPPAIGVPWVPLDPNLPLPYHFAQGWVPCTFPPKPADPQKKQKMSRAKAGPGGTRDHREPVARETGNHHRQPANPLRKRRGAAQSKAVMRPVSRPAGRGPNWKFWKKLKDEQ